MVQVIRKILGSQHVPLVVLSRRQRRVDVRKLKNVEAIGGFSKNGIFYQLNQVFVVHSVGVV
jgi:hypothetical protein